MLFFVVDNQTRSVASMIEVAHLASSQRKLLLVLHHYAGPGAFIADEAISDSEYRDLHQAQCYLADLVERQGFPVFDQIPVAINCAARLLQENIRPQELTRAGSNALPAAHRSHPIKLGDKLFRLKAAFDMLDSNQTGKITLSDIRLGFKMVTGESLDVDALLAVAYKHAA